MEVTVKIDAPVELVRQLFAHAGTPKTVDVETAVKAQAVDDIRNGRSPLRPWKDDLRDTLRPFIDADLIEPCIKALCRMRKVRSMIRQHPEERKVGDVLADLNGREPPAPWKDGAWAYDNPIMEPLEEVYKDKGGPGGKAGRTWTLDGPLQHPHTGQTLREVMVEWCIGNGSGFRFSLDRACKHAEAMGCRPKSASPLLGILIKDGYLKRTKRGMYEVL